MAGMFAWVTVYSQRKRHAELCDLYKLHCAPLNAHIGHEEHVPGKALRCMVFGSHGALLGTEATSRAAMKPGTADRGLK
jgi:hypothetical protein